MIVNYSRNIPKDISILPVYRGESSTNVIKKKVKHFIFISNLSATQWLLICVSFSLCRITWMETHGPKCFSFMIFVIIWWLIVLLIFLIFTCFQLAWNILHNIEKYQQQQKTNYKNTRTIAKNWLSLSEKLKWLFAKKDRKQMMTNAKLSTVFMLKSNQIHSLIHFLHKNHTHMRLITMLALSLAKEVNENVRKIIQLPTGVITWWFFCCWRFIVWLLHVNHL